MLNEIMAKLNQNEKLIGIGAIVAVAGWILGLILTSGWYGYSGAQSLGLLAVAAAIVAIVILYLKYAPNTNITWPLPLPLIMLILGAVAGIVGLLGLLIAFTYDPCGGLCNALLGAYGSGKPVTLYIVALAVLVGGALMTYAAYMEWVAAGKPTK